MDEMKNRTPLLSVENLEVKFNVRGRILTAIRNLSLDIYDGETIAIVGESGSGKSVLTKTFAGLLDSNGMITKGSIIFRDESLKGLANNGCAFVDCAQVKKSEDWQKIRGRKIATVFQDPMTSLNPVLTIGKQISMVIRKHQHCSAAEAKERAISIMGRVGIPEPEKRFDEYPFMYSGGMRQRIVIAIALSCQPRILICDEPTTALDVTIQAQILQLIRDLQKELGFTVVFITHDLGVVAKMAERIAVMYAGQIVEIGTAEEVFYEPKHPYTWALLSSLPQLCEPGKALYSIAGTPPSLYNEIKGDAFALRSDYAMEIDRVEEPPMFQVSPTHFAKTWLLDPQAPQVEPPENIRNLHEKMLASYVDYTKGGPDYGRK